MAMTMALPPTVSKISLVVLVFFTGLVQVDRRLLRLLPTKYICKKSVNRLILIGIFFLCKSVPLKILGIKFASI